MIVKLSTAQAKLVRDLLDTFIDACDENIERRGHGRSGPSAMDGRIARAAIRSVRAAMRQQATPRKDSP